MLKPRRLGLANGLLIHCIWWLTPILTTARVQKLPPIEFDISTAGRSAAKHQVAKFSINSGAASAHIHWAVGTFDTLMMLPFKPTAAFTL